MTQIPSEYQSPFYHWTLLLSDRLSPSFRRLGFTPNGITTLSLVCGVVAVWYLVQGTATGVLGFGVWYLIQYFFDCMDGYYARRYGLTSEFGDWYDHLKDTGLYLAICYILVRQYGLLHSPVSLLVLVSLAVLQYVYNGCLGVYRDHGPEPEGWATMTLARRWCRQGGPSCVTTRLRWLRWFGTSTCVLGVWVVVAYLWWLRSSHRG